MESFLQAQKVSVRKSLQRGFRKYLTYGEASSQLLMHKLQGLIIAKEKYNLVSTALLVLCFSRCITFLTHTYSGDADEQE